MVSKVFLALCVVVAVAAALPAGAGPATGTNPWIPPWVAAAPWMPKWAPCPVIGADCLDCTTKVVCTKIGGIEKPCADPAYPHCNMGECSATPSAQCAPAPAAAV
ncbi:hypothetical protein JYU34_000445 [Plutella xylostella]|uniref:Uncharacterized protein n=2 Tax=Plutella xylostella TaxID=51655 RepID=A0ABQ7R7R0_PLUXY|nr:hypothetical protein JYU34_000445 [Plutella xylostella]CAG9137257.1 unnamed protein product [Plutella xylostella]